MPAYPMNEEPIALPTGGVRTLIRDLGGDENPGNPPYPYTGVIQLNLGERRASIWVHGGIMYSSHLDGYNPPVALRLKTARFLSEAQFAELRDMPSGDAGPEAVDRKWVPAHIVEELHREVMLSTLSHLYDWNDAQWWWEEDETTDLYVTSGLPLMLASAAVDERIGQWKAVTRAYPHVVQPKSIPHPGPSWNKRDITIISPEMETMLAHIDGQRSIAQIAAQCGLTRFEIAKILSQTVAVGIVTFTAGATIAQAPAPTPTQMHKETLAFPVPDAAALASAPPPLPPMPDASALASAPPPATDALRPTPQAFPAPQNNADALLSSSIPYTSPDEELVSGDHPAPVARHDNENTEADDSVALLADFDADTNETVEDATEEEVAPENEEVEEKPALAAEETQTDSEEDQDGEPTSAGGDAAETTELMGELKEEMGSLLERLEAIQKRLDKLGS